MKQLTLFLLLSLTLSSCSLFKQTSKQKNIEKISQKNDVKVVKEQTQVKVSEQKGVSESSNTVSSEEITYNNGQAVAFSTTFKLDTNKKDTVVNIFNLDDSNLSFSISQDKRTNQLTAKIKTKKPQQELTVKKNYSNQTTKVDTSKKDSSSNTLRLDSTDKSKTDIRTVGVKKESKPTSVIVWIALGLGGLALIYFLVRLWLNNKTKI